MRKIIFMGQSGEEAVYYNTRTKEALVADKSALLDTEGARQSNGCIVPLILLFTFLGTIGSMVAIPAFTGFKYNAWMVIPFIVAFLFICFGFIWMLEEALYKEVKLAQPASAQQFSEAIETNLIWENFSNKRVTIGKGLLFLIVGVLLLFVTIVVFRATVPAVIDSFIKQKSFDIQIIFSPLMGLCPAVLYLIIFQNNPIRWLLAVRQYEKGNVIFVEEGEVSGGEDGSEN